MLRAKVVKARARVMLDTKVFKARAMLSTKVKVVIISPSMLEL